METKPSIYTTEFWFNIVAQIFLTLNTTHAWSYMPAHWSAIVQGIIMTGYMLSRGWAKSKGAFDPHIPANFKFFPRRKDITRSR